MLDVVVRNYSRSIIPGIYRQYCSQKNKRYIIAFYQRSQSGNHMWLSALLIQLPATTCWIKRNPKIVR